MKFWREGRPGGGGSGWRFLERFVIKLPDTGDTLLTRYRLFQTPWGGVYIHRHENPDTRRLHDHPWPFVSVVLRGGYRERRSYGPVDTHIQRFNVKRATDAHYIRSLDRVPTWTLFLVGRRQRTWGFIDEQGVWTAHDAATRTRS